jgi:hypothetical protein
MRQVQKCYGLKGTLLLAAAFFSHVLFPYICDQIGVVVQLASAIELT